MVPAFGFCDTTLPEPSIFIFNPIRLIISIAFLRLFPFRFGTLMDFKFAFVVPTIFNQGIVQYVYF